MKNKKQNTVELNFSLLKYPILQAQSFLSSVPFVPRILHKKMYNTLYECKLNFIKSVNSRVPSTLYFFLKLLEFVELALLPDCLYAIKTLSVLTIPLTSYITFDHLIGKPFVR